MKNHNLISLCEQRKTRIFNSTRRELAEIQANRKAKEQEELRQAAALRKNNLETRQPHEPAWEPRQNGFVCPMSQIDDFLSQQEHPRPPHSSRPRGWPPSPTYDYSLSFS
jgi:hypothetical protein